MSSLRATTGCVSLIRYISALQCLPHRKPKEKESSCPDTGVSLSTGNMSILPQASPREPRHKDPRPGTLSILLTLAALTPRVGAGTSKQTQIFARKWMRWCTGTQSFYMQTRLSLFESLNRCVALKWHSHLGSKDSRGGAAKKAQAPAIHVCLCVNVYVEL